ncbi:hypothetical protein B1A_21675, partial [mine drainage metagenome]
MPLRGYRFAGEVTVVGAERPPGSDADERATIPTNLPAVVSDFIGREAELITVRELLRHNRLVTLVGTGGIGKTRLG